MRLSYSGLAGLLEQNIVEVRFNRRNVKSGWNDTRRMLCTNSTSLLNSTPGRIALNFVPPKGGYLTFDPRRKNVVITWDLMFQAYRCVSLDTHDIVAVIPVRNIEEIEAFWEYFNQALQPMTTYDKVGFMNS